MHNFFDIVIVGTGPAGMAAAWAASQRGRGIRVAVLDDNPTPGGQIWRGLGEGQWFTRLASSGATLFPGTRVTGVLGDRVLASSIGPIAFERLILCTGARELFLPFPGWTRPGVMGAGGLQAMVKGGLPIAGRRVVVAGSGPLLMAVAAMLAEAGADVPVIAEQAPAAKLRALGLRFPSKLAQGAALAWKTRAGSYRTDAWPVRAVSGAVELLVRGEPHRVECDYLACGFGLVPNTELAALLGCELDAAGGRVRVDSEQGTSQEAIYCAGEPTGIGGVEQALVEGQIAGFAATGAAGRAAALANERRTAHLWRDALDEAFALRPELARLAEPDTIVCRCEGVTLGEIGEHRSWRAAKLQTRCGMGPCQGRVCGPAVERIMGWPRAGQARPPLFPVPATTLAT